MADDKVLIIMTSGPTRPRRCATPFFFASLAAAMEYDVTMFFTIDGTLLLKKGVAETIYPKAGGKPVSDFLQDALEAGVKFPACTASTELHDLQPVGSDRRRQDGRRRIHVADGGRRQDRSDVLEITTEQPRRKAMANIRGCNLPEDLYYLIEKHVWAKPHGRRPRAGRHDRRRRQAVRRQAGARSPSRPRTSARKSSRARASPRSRAASSSARCRRRSRGPAARQRKAGQPIPTWPSPIRTARAGSPKCRRQRLGSREGRPG